MATKKRTSNQQNTLLDSNGFKYYREVFDSDDDYLTKTENDNLELVSVNSNAKSIVRTQNVQTTNTTKIETIIGNLNKIDIADGLDLLGFEACLSKDEVQLSRLVRLRCHASYIYACAQATYFVGNANKLRRNLNDILVNEIKPQYRILLNESQGVPGLRIGVIGGGRLACQLVTTLLEYGDVKPSEIHISTRQPDTLHTFKNAGIECVFANREVTNKSNILFLCVLPSQLQDVIDEIKQHIPKKCIIYSFVRTIPITRLRNLINVDVDSFIIKPDYEFNTNEEEIFKKWNYTLDTIESLNNSSMILLTNPLGQEPEKIMLNSVKYIPSIIYALINICIFLKLDKKQTLAAMSAYVFNTTFEKKFTFDETLFFDKSNDQSFTSANLIKVAIEKSKFESELERYPELVTILSETYVEYFENIYKWKNAYK